MAPSNPASTCDPIARMKLLLVTNDFPPRIGGIEDYVDQLLRHLPAEVRATVLGPPHPDAAAHDAAFPHRVVRWPRGPLLPTPALISAVVALAGQERPDVVLFGAALPLALMAGSVSERTGIPIVAFTHGVEPAAALLPGGPTLLRRIARHTTLTVVSSWAERRLRRAMGDIPLMALPSGVDATRFHPGVRGHGVRVRHHLEGVPLVVGVSRLVARKGHDLTIRAWPSVRSRVPGARLMIVGDGPDRARLEALARNLGVADAVTFTGVVSGEDLPAHFAAGDVFAMPNRVRWCGLDDEALGAVFLQAAAVGRAVVAGDAGGAGEAIVDGVTGHLTDGHDHQALADMLVRLLADPAYASRLGSAGARRIQDAYTWQRMANRLHDLLQELAGARRP